MWYHQIIQIFKIRELRNKILFVLAMLTIFRIMANIPVPGINTENLKALFRGSQALGQLFGMMNLFVGGTLDNLSIIMLGIGPYITATIILQLLTMIFPQLEKIYKEEGEAGRQRFNQYGRLLTVPLAILQGYAMLMLFQRQQIIGSLAGIELVSSLLTIAAGTVFLMWLGELISEKGIGNGISLLIFAGIVSAFPVQLGQMLAWQEPGVIPRLLLFGAMCFLIIAGVVLVNQARRNIAVSYAKRVRGMKMYGGVSTYLPLSVNPAGVIPIIFALSILLFPGMLANFFVASGGLLGKIAQGIANFFNPQTNPWGYGSFYFILVVLFTYFYTMITFDPKAIANNLQKMGGFVPGIRPGSSTANFLSYILNRVLPIGALFLGFIAVMPWIVRGLTRVQQFQFLVGGTALLIIVSVVLETMQQIKAQLGMREYETF